MRLGKTRILILTIFFFIINESILHAIDKIETVPLINLEELSPTFEEDKDVLENKEDQTITKVTGLLNIRYIITCFI